ncbi:hypothetical protein EDB81DRAFT_836339 [Dactylonectria macrodidyma]|uniref:Uncharacterized protein n=1 Tax=Dactylonectria macrodidyma TaxID=307937 RepID=A0A9P9FUH1_9HYPO|nr:hypothetical protein EDB81DRAFT_836339 [Dactylonectria macrodidyma]
MEAGFDFRAEECNPIYLRDTRTAILVVVYALDECEWDDDVKFIINLFSCVITLQSLRLRILVTSRPDLPIRLGFSAIMSKHQDLVLYEMPENIVKHNISAFLRHELAVIRSNYNNSIAVPLSIFAVTICRLLADCRCSNPDKSQESQLNATYLPVLNQLVVDLPTRQREKAVQEFRVIVGSIVILDSSLFSCALAQMLNLLHSVLNIPPSSSSPVRLLHLSFRDFLVDEKSSHGKMTANCLRVINERLRTDICNKIEVYLPPEVQYACLHWVYHI